MPSIPKISRLTKCIAGLLPLVLTWGLAGCVTVSIPVDEYNLARAAVDGARESDAPRFAPGLWYKAEEAYKEGQRRYRERDYSKARQYFIEAKFMAEKAENAARVARFQSGEDAP